MDPHCSLHKVFILVNMKQLRVTLQDFNPKLSDFGLARHGPLEDQSHVSTRILGTRGYVAPEYFTTGKCFSLSF